MKIAKTVNGKVQIADGRKTNPSVDRTCEKLQPLQYTEHKGDNFIRAGGGNPFFASESACFSFICSLREDSFSCCARGGVHAVLQQRASLAAAAVASSLECWLCLQKMMGIYYKETSIPVFLAQSPVFNEPLLRLIEFTSSPPTTSF